MTQGLSKSIKLLAVAVVLLLIVAMLLLPATQSLLRSTFLGWSEEKVPAGTSIGVQRTLEVEANGGLVQNASIVLGLPPDVISGQTVLQDATISSAPAYTLEVRNGSRYIRWEADELRNRESLQVTITYHFIQSTKVWDLSNGQVGTTDDVPQSLRQQYLHDEWKIVVNNTAIRSLANTLEPSSENVLETVRAIYDWMVDNVQYPAQTISGDPKSSLETLSSRTGDCDEQAILFCALARSVGIPAWVQLGMIYDPSTGEVGGHGWVQCYIPFKNGGGVDVTIDPVNRDFLVWTPYHILDYSGNGNGDDLEDYYSVFHCLYDPTTYDDGDLPFFSDGWEVVSYQETEDRVTTGSFISMAI
ncbi:MAG TPA: transglutaminase domain-containing protein, partial [Methanomassiliicoccales archaeon]|nr:transglutaminase domain-containing protein [Methanomassiliicoccales archaeon]